MKQFKKLVTLGLVLTMIFTLAACSSETKDGANDATKTTVATTATETIDTEATSSEDIIDTDVDADANIDASTDADNDEDTLITAERRAFGEIALPQNADDIPVVFEEVAALFPVDTTEEVKAQALELFTTAELAEIANDSEAATTSWESFDALRLIAE